MDARAVCTALVMLATLVAAGQADRRQLRFLKAQLEPEQVDNVRYRLDDIVFDYNRRCQMLRRENAAHYYGPIVKAAAIFSECIDTVPAQFMDHITHRAPTDLHGMFCDKMIATEICMYRLYESLKYCLPPDQHLQNNITMMIGVHALQFNCPSESEQLMRIFSNLHGPSCIERNRNELDKCLLSRQENANITLTLGGLRQRFVQTWECVALEIYEQCILRLLENCNQIMPPSRTKALFAIFSAQQYCNKMVPHGLMQYQRKSAAHLHRADSVLILVIVCTIILLPTLCLRKRHS